MAPPPNPVTLSPKESAMPNPGRPEGRPTGGPGSNRRAGPVRLRQQPAVPTANPLPRLKAVMQRAANQQRRDSAEVAADRARALVQRYLRERWRVEPRIVRCSPNPVEPGTWTVVVEDPRNPAAALQPVTMRVDPTSGVVGILS